MSDNRTTELQSLSKLKKAGRLRYWRGTIEIPETELHAICDEIQAEHDQAIAAATLGSNNEYEAKMDALLCRLTNGKWSKTRQYSLEFMVSCVDEEYDDAYEKERAEQGSGTCERVEVGTKPDGTPRYRCSNCKYGIGDMRWAYCPNCGKRIRKAVER